MNNRMERKKPYKSGELHFMYFTFDIHLKMH